jgi:hypothetical protein
MPSDTAGIVSGWLRGLPEGAVLRWGDDGLTANRPYACRGVDPVVAGAPVAWPWHVLGPDDPDAAAWDGIALIVPYDLDTFEVWPAGPCHGPLGVYRVGRDLPLDVVTAAAISRLRALPGAMLSVAGGWLPTAISRALADWASLYAGRSDLRFRWDADERSAVVRAFARYARRLEASQSRDTGWVALRPAASRTRFFDADTWELGEEEHGRRARRVADAQAWVRRSNVEPMLNWLTPAEVAALLHLGPDQDVLTWCLRHAIPSRPSAGLEPEFAAGPVLALAQDAAWPDSTAS